MPILTQQPVIGLVLTLFVGLPPSALRAGVGADLPWTTYEAEAMHTTGSVLGPEYDPYRVETESSHQQCVKLTASGDFVEFTAQAPANTIVVRYSLPDSERGGGLNSSLNLLVNGERIRTLPMTSRYSWLYGAYPFSNDPAQGKPRNFYDEVRAKDLAIAKGDVVRLEKADAKASYCIVDLVDLEQVAAPLAPPADALSLASFGADGGGVSDSTEALRRCIAAACRDGKRVWLPPGIYRLSGDIVLPSNVTLQGAGMWHTTFLGDEDLYGQADRRVRFKVSGENVHLADFAIVGRLNYRNDQEPNDGIVGAGGTHSSILRVWVEHTKAGVWCYKCSHLRVDSCRFRNLLADGLNFCVDTRHSIVENCTARGTGDDCFAIWPAPSDQGYEQTAPLPGFNVIRRCTGQLPFLANGASIYGGTNNVVEDCLFTDISTGCGILISTTFPTVDESRGINNNFSGATRIENCDLIRCGGYDHGWTWRGAFQLCVHGRDISGVVIRNVNIRDSFSDGLTVVGPDHSGRHGTLSDVSLENVRILNPGLGADGRHSLWIREDARGSLTLNGSDILDIRNESTGFSILRK